MVLGERNGQSSVHTVIVHKNYATSTSSSTKDAHLTLDTKYDVLVHLLNNRRMLWNYSQYGRVVQDWLSKRLPRTSLDPRIIKLTSSLDLNGPSGYATYCLANVECCRLVNVYPPVPLLHRHFLPR